MLLALFTVFSIPSLLANVDSKPLLQNSIQIHKTQLPDLCISYQLLQIKCNSSALSCSPLNDRSLIIEKQHDQRTMHLYQSSPSASYSYYSSGINNHCHTIQSFGKLHYLPVRNFSSCYFPSGHYESFIKIHTTGNILPILFLT